jgi:hypothetical protein
MNKKIGALFLTTFVISLFLVSFASANTFTDGVKTVADSIAKSTEPTAQFLLGNAPTGELLLVKVLFFILLLSILYLAVNRIPQLSHSAWTVWLISIIISILAVRYLSTASLIEFIWLPQGVLGITLATLFPLIIYFLFIESFDSKIIRKVGWVTFAVIYFAIAMVRWESLRPENITGFAGQKVPEILINLGWVYLAIAVISILAIVFDKKLRAMIVTSETVQIRKDQLDLQIAKKSDKLDQLQALAANNPSLDRQVDRAQRSLDKLTQERAGL